jgi:hypothetical protein
MENKKKMKNILDGGDGGFLALTIVWQSIKKFIKRISFAYFL